MFISSSRARIHIEPWSTFISTPEASEKQALVRVNDTVTNQSALLAQCVVFHDD